MVKILLEHGKVGFRGCVSKRGNKFSAYFYYEKDENIKAAVDFIVSEDLVKVGDKERLERLQKELISKDWFMTLIDLAEYIDKKEEVYAAYEDQDAWNKKVVYNIAEAGFFSSDRTIEQYDKDIWHTK